MRDWELIDKDYEELLASVYPQPEDEGHTTDARKFIEWAFEKMGRGMVRSCIDLGCGTGFCQPMLERQGVKQYTGVVWNEEDYKSALAMGRDVFQADFHFLPNGMEYDAALMRHSLEHSYFPHLLLMGLRRIVKRVLIVVPALEWFHAGRKGTNHPSVFNEEQWLACFNHVGLVVEHQFHTFHAGSPDRDAPNERTLYEYWYVCMFEGERK